MTDYFALLEQPRRPSLDVAQLKEIFHAKTLRAHPDANKGDSISTESGFAELNEAYQVLRDPKRRLHHLLTLAGHSPSSRSGAVPKEIENLFAIVAGLTHEAGDLVQQLHATTNPLARSLLKPQVIATSKRLGATIQDLKSLSATAEGELHSLNDFAGTDECVSELQMLYARFSYLRKWIEQLEEKQLQLAL